MAKRYHQTKKDRLHESAGEMMHDKMELGMRRDESTRDPYMNERNASSEWNNGRMGSKMDGYGGGRDRYNEERFGRHGARREMEMRESGYLYEDHKAVANMPQEVIMRSYPRTGPYMPEVLRDDIGSVDAQIDLDDRLRRDSFYPKKV